MIIEFANRMLGLRITSYFNSGDCLNGCSFFCFAVQTIVPFSKSLNEVSDSFIVLLLFFHNRSASFALGVNVLICFLDIFDCAEHIINFKTLEAVVALELFREHGSRVVGLCMQD